MRNLFYAVALLVLTGPVVIRANDPAASEIVKWRANHDRGVLGADGPFTFVARLTPKQGVSSIGHDASNDLLIPVSSAPPRVGTIEWRGDGEATFHIQHGVAALVEDKPVSEVVISKPVTIKITDFSVRAAFRDALLRVAILDPNAKMRKTAQAPVWFPIDLRYRVKADWIPFAEPRTLRLPDSDGGSREWKSPGYVSFALDGERNTLQAVLTPDGKELSFLFRDGTTGQETYGAGRYLEADLPSGGKVLMDFNKAYNPFCEYNALYICPIPPKGNHLKLRIAAGERTYPKLVQEH